MRGEGRRKKQWQRGGPAVFPGEYLGLGLCGKTSQIDIPSLTHMSACLLACSAELAGDGRGAGQFADFCSLVRTGRRGSPAVDASVQCRLGQSHLASAHRKSVQWRAGTILRRAGLLAWMALGGRML